jgi:hypothetical protein
MSSLLQTDPERATEREVFPLERFYMEDFGSWSYYSLSRHYDIPQNLQTRRNMEAHSFYYETLVG